jgi:hypothetical protein
MRGGDLMTPDLQEIGGLFEVFGAFIQAVPCGNGHINDTFAATYDQGGIFIRYIHQRINHKIFRDPPAQMENIVRVTDHIRRKLAGAESHERTRHTLTLVPSRDGAPFCRDTAGNYWRTYVLIEGTRSLDVAESPAQARQSAIAFGRFQRLLADLDGPRLHETIPDFHNTPKRFEAFEQALREDPCGRAAAAQPEIAFATARKPMTGVLLELSRRGEVPERIVHNDTKFNNVLLDQTSGEGVCVIDLDTVMPGLSLYDFGDMVRSTTSPAPEDEIDLSRVKMQMPMFEALVHGYLQEVGDILTPTEKRYLAFSGRLITFEIGIRFLTDFLLGDRYFKTARKQHNLDRCRTQFKLIESMEQQEREMDAVVARYAGGERGEGRGASHQ